MRPLLVLLVGMQLAYGGARAPAPFADVPPCHWAAEAVAELAEVGIFIGFPVDHDYLAANALRQVFEGLRCDDLDWSRAFIEAAPEAFAEVAGVQLVGFALDTVVVERVGPRAEIGYSLTTVVEHQATRITEVREGTIEAQLGAAGWQVAYADLADLALPVFPH